MLKERGNKNFDKLRKIIDENQENIIIETKKLIKKHHKKNSNKEMIDKIEYRIKKSKIGNVNIIVSSDSNLISFFDKYFPNKKHLSIGKGENIMILKHLSGYSFIRNFIDENNEPKFEYKFYKSF